MIKTGIKTNPLFESTIKHKAQLEPEKTTPIRCTHYISQDTVAKIQKLKLEIFNKDNTRASISRIVEIAIDMLYQDHESKRNDSYMLKHINTKT